ncbi:uncharacterized mitochondrial protein-like protein [Tanacetum coccineum]
MLVQVYVDDIIFGSTKKSMCTKFEECMHKRFQMSSMGELTFFLGLQVKQQPDGIFISQDKYVADILKKFDFLSIRTATTPIESNKPLVKDKDGIDVDVHVYRSMIGSLMYLTASRPDIMFAVCAYARFQVTLKASHLNAVKRIFRYLKHQPKLGLWYPRDSPFELEAYSDSDYGGASLDRKSTTGGCQFLGRRLISWQCKKQTIMANSTTEAEYVAAANCCGQHWIIESIATIEGRQDALLYTLYRMLCEQTDFANDASIRSDLLFDDADGIDSMNNQALFDNIQLMGNQLKDVPVPLDHFPVPTLTKKVLTFMVKKGKNFSGKVTPLFDSMLVQQIEDEGEASERPSDSQPIPSPPHPSEDQPQIQTDPSPRPSPSIAIPDSNPEGSGGNHGGQSSSDRSLSGNEDGLTLQSVYDLCISLCTQVSAQAKEIKALKAQVKKLKKGVKPLITHHKAWMKSVALKTRLARKTSLKKKEIQLLMILMMMQWTIWRLRMLKMRGGQALWCLKRRKVQIRNTKVSTDRQGEGTADQNEGKSATQTAPTTTSTPTPIIFGDDETIAQVLIIKSQNRQKEKEKGVKIRNVEDTERPRPTSTRSVLTLKPLPKIDLKDKGKKMIDEEGESDTESDDITEAEKKFKMLAKDEEVARKVQEEWEAEEEKKRLAEEEATKVALTNEYDFIQARINADKILAEELQKEEREKFTIEQRAKFLHDTIAAQRKFLAQQRSEAIRNKPPTRNQLRKQMMTYLKHVGGKKHFDLKTKTFEEIQVLYERLKRQDQNFVAIGSAEDERQIKELNKDPKKKRVIKETPRKEDTAKVPAEQEVTEQGTKKRKSGHVKMIARKRPRPQPDDDSDDEHRKCLRIVTFDSTIDSEIMETKSFIARLHKVSSPDGNYLVVYRVNGHFRAFNYLMEGDLKIMMESSTEENDQGDFWNNQQEWEIVRWRLYEACGVCILELKDGTVIYMLVERKYPLSKELLQQMLDLGLEVEEESTAALQLLASGIVKMELYEACWSSSYPRNCYSCNKCLFVDLGLEVEEESTVAL